MEKWVGIIAVGIAVFFGAYHYSRRILDWLRFSSLGNRDYVVERLGMMFIEIDPNRVLVYMTLIAVLPAVLIFVLLYPLVAPGLGFGLIFFGLGWKAPRFLVDTWYERRVNLFTNQMIDALDLMSNGLKSGLSVVQAIGLATQEMPDPVRQELGLVLSENRLGVSIEESFNNLAKRIQSEDVEMFVTSINILRETGGNLAETFDTISKTIRERIKVQNKIQAMTATGFYQGMFVMAVTPLMGAVFYVSDPEFMEPLFTTTLGWVLIAVIILLETVGFLLIKRIIRIEV